MKLFTHMLGRFEGGYKKLLSDQTGTATYLAEVELGWIVHLQPIDNHTILE